MEYYLQVLIGGLVLIAVTVPLSDNYKQIKVKNILRFHKTKKKHFKLNTGVGRSKTKQF